jgi:hypothetical protein
VILIAVCSKAGWLMADNSDQVRVRAYELWELAGKSSGDNDRFWREAVAEFEFRRVPQELEKQIQAVRHAVE